MINATAISRVENFSEISAAISRIPALPEELRNAWISPLTQNPNRVVRLIEKTVGAELTALSRAVLGGSGQISVMTSEDEVQQRCVERWRELRDAYSQQQMTTDEVSHSTQIPSDGTTPRYPTMTQMTDDAKNEQKEEPTMRKERQPPPIDPSATQSRNTFETPGYGMDRTQNSRTQMTPTTQRIDAPQTRQRLSMELPPKTQMRRSYSGNAISHTAPALPRSSRIQPPQRYYSSSRLSNARGCMNRVVRDAAPTLAEQAMRQQQQRTQQQPPTVPQTPIVKNLASQFQTPAADDGIPAIPIKVVRSKDEQTRNSAPPPQPYTKRQNATFIQTPTTNDFIAAQIHQPPLQSTITKGAIDWDFSNVTGKPQPTQMMIASKPPDTDAPLQSAATRDRPPVNQYAISQQPPPPAVTNADRNAAPPARETNARLSQPHSRAPDAVAPDNSRQPPAAVAQPGMDATRSPFGRKRHLTSPMQAAYLQPRREQPHSPSLQYAAAGHRHYAEPPAPPSGLERRSDRQSSSAPYAVMGPRIGGPAARPDTEINRPPPADGWYGSEAAVPRSRLPTKTFAEMTPEEAAATVVRKCQFQEYRSDTPLADYERIKQNYARALKEIGRFDGRHAQFYDWLDRFIHITANHSADIYMAATGLITKCLSMTLSVQIQQALDDVSFDGIIHWLLMRYGEAHGYERSVTRLVNGRRELVSD